MNAENREPESREQLRMALAGLRASAERGKTPTRHQARDLLLALGAEICAADSSGAEHAIESLRSITPPGSAFADRWRTAVADEISMACTEHVRSVEPRFLDHPQYDFEYTIAARERLEFRLRAAEKLGLPATPDGLRQVDRADALFAASLERRAKRTGRQI